MLHQALDTLDRHHSRCSCVSPMLFAPLMRRLANVIRQRGRYPEAIDVAKRATSMLTAQVALRMLLPAVAQRDGRSFSWGVGCSPGRL